MHAVNDSRAAPHANQRILFYDLLPGLRCCNPLPSTSCASFMTDSLSAQEVHKYDFNLRGYQKRMDACEHVCFLAHG